MKQKYIIQIKNTDSYPFDGQKHQSFSVRVKTCIPILGEGEWCHKKINILMHIQCQLLIQILKITELKDKEYQIYYEYFPENLKNSQRHIEFTKLKTQLQILAEYLTQNCIETQITAENLAVANGNIKFYLGTHFNLADHPHCYKTQIDKILEQYSNHQVNQINQLPLSQYSANLDKKLSAIEQRIQQMKNKNKTNSILVHKMQFGEDLTSSEDSSDDKNKHKKIKELRNGKKIGESNIVLQNLAERQSANSSFSGLTSHSLITSNGSKFKQHKSSFGDYSTPSCRFDISKDKTLKKRVSTALQKTKQAFEFYQKLQQKHRL